MEELFESVMHLIFLSAKSWIKSTLFKLLSKKTTRLPLATIDDIRVLHQSPNFLVVDKHYDVLINSDDPNDKVTVEHQLRKMYPELANENLSHSFYFTHRLDYPTSGVLCLTTRREAAAMAGKTFERRKAIKYYLALVRGHVHHSLVDIKISIGTDERPEYERRMCTGDKSYCFKPKASFTRLLVLERGLYNKNPATKVLLKPLTGRRHQLRLHCKSLGHTIVGDFTYSNRMDVDPHRMFLHSHRLILPTPVEMLDVCAGDPFTADLKENSWKPCDVIFNDLSEAYQIIDCDIADLTIESPLIKED